MTKAQNTGFINLDFYLYITLLNNQPHSPQTMNTAFYRLKPAKRRVFY